MPTHTARVGPQTLPVTTAGQDSALRPPIEVGILDFFGYLTKQALDAKLGEMRGPVTSAAITDALPAGHRFPWNHNGTFMRPLPAEVALAASEGRQPQPPLPAGYCWRVSTQPTAMGATLIRRCVEHEIKLHYIFPQLQIPGGFDARSGLMAAVADQASRYFGEAFRTRHPNYGYNGDAAGTPLVRSLNLVDISLVRAQHGGIAVTPTGSAQGTAGRPGNEGHVQRFFPSVEMTLRVIAPIDTAQPVEPDDVLSDSTVDMNVGESVGDTVFSLDAVLIAPRDLP